MYMSNQKTPEEVKKEYIDIMGEPLGKFFNALWQEVAWLYTKWNEYVALYGTKPSRIDLMNKAAPRFFRIVQDSLWEVTLLHIARLTDPPKSAGKDNLSIKRIPGNMGCCYIGYFQCFNVYLGFCFPDIQNQC